jgi:hypothetical protein
VSRLLLATTILFLFYYPLVGYWCHSIPSLDVGLGSLAFDLTCKLNIGLVQLSLH